MDNFFSRLDKFMRFKGLNDNKITVQAKIAVGTLGKQRRGGKGLSYESISKILYTYPELSAEWLMTGKGEMIKVEEEAPADLISLVAIVNKLSMEVTRLNEKSDLLINQMEYIRLQLSTAQETNNRLVAQIQNNISDKNKY